MKHLLGALSIVGSIASLVGLLYVFYDKQAVWAGILSVVALLGTIGAIVVHAQSKAHRPWRMKRDGLLEQGRKLINASSRTVVMFGRDLSWVGDYTAVIVGARGRGATVTVICAVPEIDETRRWIAALEELGASVVQISFDHGIRATLIDHNSQAAAKLFVATKIRVADRDPSRVEYECKTYHASSDAMLISAMTQLSRSWMTNATTGT